MYKAQATRLNAEGTRLKPQGSMVCALGLVTCALFALSASGCAKAQAATVPSGPPLQVPQPPPRVLVPVEEAVIAAPAPAPEAPPPAPATRTPPRPVTEPRPQPAPPAAATPAPAPAPTPPEPRELRAAPSPTNATTERTVRDTLARATRDINRVDYGKLSADGRTQYEQSKRFSQQAEEALKERNVLFAATLADKAAQIAAELLGR